MIIIRYLARETFKSQIAILFILLLIFFCQKLVRVLSAAVEGNIPTNLVFSLMFLGVPEMAQLILPLSLFLAILLTYGKLYAESEITVMHACGLGKDILLKSALLLALFTAALSAANSIWLTPWSAKYQTQVLADAKANPGIASLVEGQFQRISGGNTVLFVGEVNGSQFHNIFLAQLRPSGNQRPSIIVADTGKVTQNEDGTQMVHLNQGNRYEGSVGLNDFRITEFSDYQARIGHQETQTANYDIEQASFRELWQQREQSHTAWTEINWRLTLIFSAIIMALMVVPLSIVNPRQGRVASMLPAMLLYLIYFLLQSSLRSNGMRGKIDPIIWVWVVNGFYLALAIFLNLWDSLPMRRLRVRLKGTV